MHANFGTFGNPGRNGVLSGTWHPILAFRHHAWAALCADPPASCLQLGVFGDGIVLPWARLEVLGLLKSQIAASLSSDLEGWLLVLGSDHFRVVVAGSRLKRLLLSLWTVRHSRSHRVGRQILASELLRTVVAWAWHLELSFDFFASGCPETETGSSSLNPGGILIVATWPW